MISFQSVFPPFRGGISKFSDHLYSELQNITEVTAHNYRVLYPSLFFPGKSQFIYNYGKPYANSVVHSYNFLNRNNEYKSMIDSDTETFIYSHWHPFFIPAQLGILNRIQNYSPSIKTVGIIHNVIPHERFPFTDKLIRKLFSKTDYPIVLSNQTAGEYERIMRGRKPHKLFHPVYKQDWPNESRETIREMMGYSEKDCIVIFFGLVRPYKGLDVLIDALNLINLEKLNIKPVIVGEFYIDPDSVLKRIKKEHLHHYEIINRFVLDEEAARYLYMSDVMVLPYKSASQSGVLSNALNFDLPVLVSNLEGLTEQVRHGSTGYIFEPEDQIGLAKYLCDLVQDNKLPEMRKNVKSFKDSLSWEIFARELIQIIES